MAITYEDAVAKVQEWTDSPALRNHARGVEVAIVVQQGPPSATG